MIKCFRYRYPIIQIGRIRIDAINTILELIERFIQKYLCPNFKDPMHDFAWMFDKIQFPIVTKVFDKTIASEMPSVFPLDFIPTLTLIYYDTYKTYLFGFISIRQKREGEK